MTTSSNLMLLITALGTALMAGLFYAWSCSVVPGTAQLTDQEYIAAMQAMNRAIINPAFLIFFLGTALLLPINSYMEFNAPLTARFWFLVAASCFYCFGVTGITFAGNIPLNNAMESFQLHGATVAEVARQRAAFEKPWNALHTIRMFCSVAALVFMLLACLSPKHN